MGIVIGVSVYSTASPRAVFVRVEHTNTCYYLRSLTSSPPPPFHLRTGCVSSWCPCIVFSKNKQRLQSLQQHGTPLPGDADTFDGYCCIYGLLGGNGWILQVGCRDVDKMPICYMCMFTLRPDSTSCRTPPALWHSWGRGFGLFLRHVLPLLCAHAGTSGNRIGGEQSPCLIAGVMGTGSGCSKKHIFSYIPLPMIPIILPPVSVMSLIV
jgi:hypothetical protein